MKVTELERQEFKKRYNQLYTEGGLTKTQAISIIADEFDRGKTTIYDNIHMPDESGIEIAEPIIRESPEFIPKSMPSVGYEKRRGNKTYILTGWEIRIGINEPFLECLDTLAKELNAEQLLVPIWHKDVDFVPQRLKDQFEIINEGIEFNDNLIFHYSPTHALVTSALAGWAGAFPGKSVILGGLIKELTTEPSHISCKQLMTTGSVGYLDAGYEQYDGIKPDYDSTIHTDFYRRWNNVAGRNQGKTTAIAQKFIVPSALIVDIIDDNIFLTRYVSMHESGVIYDLDKKITKDKVVKNTPSALVLGDYHVWTMDENTHKVNKEMIEFFKPKETILNDTFDGASVCYHEQNDSILQSKAPSIEEEATLTKKVIKELTNLGKMVYLHSNHCEFLVKWLNSGERFWRTNGNLADCYELQAYRIRTGKHPIIKLLDLETTPNLYFSSDRETYYVNNVVTAHGHEFYRGGGFKSFVKAYNNVVTGHEHKPQVFRNGVCVGATATREQSYSIGVSASMGANCLIQPDDSLQLLNIIGTVWKR